MSQSTQILQHMKTHGSITALQAIKHYGCLRLSARVYDLKSKGYGIESQRWRTRSGKTVSRYWLLTEGKK